MALGAIPSVEAPQPDKEAEQEQEREPQAPIRPEQPPTIGSRRTLWWLAGLLLAVLPLLAVLIVRQRQERAHQAEQAAQVKQVGEEQAKRDEEARAKPAPNDPRLGIVVKILGVIATPEQVTPGQSIALKMDYSVLAPSENANVPVRETIELWKDNQILQKFEPQEGNRSPGRWHSEATFPIPKGAPAGTYLLKTRVEAGGSYDERETHFVVGG